MIEKDLSTKLLKIWSINLFLLQESIFKMVNNYTVEADKNELLIGNSTTTPRDLENDLDVWIIQIALAESVAARLRKHGFKCKTVEITVRDNGLYSFSRQIHLRQPTNITNEIVTAAFQLFKDNYKWEHPIRSLGIRAADLVLDDIPVQLDLFGNQEKKEKLEKLDRTVDEIRRRFGYFSIQRAAMYQDKVLSHLDAGTHTIHPHSYFHR